MLKRKGCVKRLRLKDYARKRKNGAGKKRRRRRDCVLKQKLKLSVSALRKKSVKKRSKRRRDCA